MNINEAIKVAIKCRNCANASAYNCSLLGCENCENDYDAMEYTEMLDVFINYFNKCADETIDDFYYLLKNQLTIDALTCAKDKFTVLSIINRQYNNMKASLNHTRTEGEVNKRKKVRDLYERYVDACSMCRACDCDKCHLDIVIRDLYEILSSTEGDNNV